MRKGNVLILIGLVFIGIALFLIWDQGKRNSWEILSPLGSLKQIEEEKPLEKYSFENLKRRGGQRSEIKLEKVLKEEKEFTAYLFSYLSEGRKITGLANLPKGETQFPVIIMIRGYIDQEDYQTGEGTRKAGEVWVKTANEF